MSEKIAVQPERLRAERFTIASSCCGFTGEAVLTESAVIMLFAGMLGAGESLKLLTTAVFPFLSGLLMLPMAFLAMKSTCRKMTVIATILAAAAYILTVFTPLTGAFKVQALLILLIVFAVSLSGFVAGWFPLLDTFLLPEERTGYLGKMRLCHQLSAVLFLLLTSLIIGQTPSMRTMQCVLWCGALIFTGRLFFIWAIPDLTRGPASPARKAPEGSGLIRAVKNRELTVFSIYQFVLNFLICGTIPVATVYMKNDLALPENRIVMIGGIALAGMSLGYLSAKRLRQKYSLRGLCLAVHLAAMLIPLLLFFLTGSGDLAACILCLVLVAAAFLMALSSILCNVWMMDLAAPDNKVMAMAWSGMFFYCGWGCSRLFPSLFLGRIYPWIETIIPWSPCRTIFLLWAVLLLPALFLFFRIPRKTEGTPL